MASLAVMGGAAAHGQPSTQEKLSKLDQSFVCPEDLPSDEAKQDAVKLFVERLRAIQPTMTVEEFARYRLSMLAKHHCDQTLAYINRQTSGSAGAGDTSARWARAGQIGRGDGNVMTISVDMGSMVDAGPGRMKTWVKYRNSAPDHDGVIESLVYEQLDCVRRLHTTISLIRYAPDGHVVSNDSGGAEAPIVPDSLLADILPFTCAAHGLTAR